jgi:parvulin-like peptidyl-prolyl isomerase
MNNEDSSQSDQSNQRPDYLRADKVSTPRAMVMYASGVVIGLILGGIGLFNARGTTTNTVPKEDLAIVNQRPILRSDFITQLETETGLPFAETTREDQLRVLDEMLREELFVQRGLELDFAETDQDTRYALFAIVEQQITADVSISKDTDEELQAYFDKNKEQFKTEGKLDVHNLVLQDGDSAKAAQAAQALRDGASLDEVKQHFGLTEGEYYPDEYAYLAKIHLGDAVFAKVQALDSGQVSEPIQSDDGYHIVQVIHHSKPQQETFEEAKSDLQTAYYNSEKARVMNNMMNFLRGRSNILIADDYKDDYNPDDFAGTY